MSLDSLRVRLADRYRIERELGQGGMATVYLADDLRHDRQVAIKVLKSEISAVIGAERFLREIKTIAALQHPHILGLIDSGEVDDTAYFVMPYVEGESLRDRLNRERQLPIADALSLTADVASALDYAHRHGVIHRDIKPENILLHDGRALVADFGIALAVTGAGGGTRITETGLSLGTPMYMAPEQAMGDRHIGPAADVYSLAATLYEMLAGEPPFQGNTAQAIIAKVLTERPAPVSRARETVPRHVAAAVHRGLARLPADRFPTAAAFADALARPGAFEPAGLEQPEQEPGRAPGLTRRSSRAALIGVIAVAVLSTALGTWAWLRPPTRARTLWIPVAFPRGQYVASRPGPSIALAPDGSRLAYVGPGTPEPQIWLWDFGRGRRDSVPGTVGAINPAFSPDGASLAFEIGGLGVLETVSLAGGPPRRLADSVSLFGEAWGPDNYIYYARVNGTPGISRVPATGGPAEIVTVADSARGEMDHRWLSILPNGKAALFTIWSGTVDGSEIAAVDLRTRHVTPLFKGVSARYVPPGRIVYAQADRTLSAVPFNQGNLAVGGRSVPLIGSISVKVGDAADFSVSENGTLAYMTGAAPVEELVWVTRTGGEQPVDSRVQGEFTSLRLSPTGDAVAVSLDTPTGESLWSYEFASGALSRLTFDGRLNRRPVWVDNGRALVYASDRDRGGITLWRIPAGGGRAPEPVLPHGIPDQAQDASLSPDGRLMVYRRGPGRTGNLELMVFAPGAGATAEPYFATRTRATSPRVAPDGHWLAYVSRESGRDEVYVQSLPRSGGRWQVSLDGGTEPAWSPTGTELFYRNGADQLVAASVATGSAFAVHARHALFSTAPYAHDFNRALYDVGPDGQRFLMVKILAGSPPLPDLGGSEEQLMLVLNWTRELDSRLAQQ